MFCAVFTTPWCPPPPNSLLFVCYLRYNNKTYYRYGSLTLIERKKKRKEKEILWKKMSNYCPSLKNIRNVQIFCIHIPCLPVIFSEIENYAFKISLKIPIYENMNRPTIMHLDNWLDLKRPCETKLNCYIMFSCC